jgi:cysteine-rich repeat protein
MNALSCNSARNAITVASLALGGCLPALDPAVLGARADASIDGSAGDSAGAEASNAEASGDATHADAANLCIDGSPNAKLESPEQCDDGNRVEDDGCTSTCVRNCEQLGGVERPATRSCYFLKETSVSPDEAEQRCAAAGNQAHVLTVGSEKEAGFIRDSVLPVLLSNVSVSEVLLGMKLNSDNARWFSLVPGEPGWSATMPCPGCYQNWDKLPPEVDATNHTAVLSRSASWQWVVRPDTGKYALVCERDLPGLPKNLCGQDPEAGSCDPEKTYEWNPYWTPDSKVRYRVVVQSKSFEDARSACQSWAQGADLVALRSEDERAQIVRFVVLSRLAEGFWIGLQRNGSDWTWVGDSTAAEWIPWSSANPSGGNVGEVVTTDGFDTNLVQAVSSGAAVPSYVCRREP